MLITRMSTVLWCLGACFVGCSSNDPGAGESQAGSSGSPPSTSGSDSRGSDSTDNPSTENPSTDNPATTSGVSTDQVDESGPPPVVFDVGKSPDTPFIEEGCQGIDFLFVVDNSGSMTSQQAKFLNSFQGFITAVEDSLGNVNSFNLGVITSDNFGNNAPGCTTIGSLVTRTTGAFESSNMDCEPFEDGHRFLTEEDDLAVKFPCIAQVGTSGSPIEQPVTALIAALDPEKAESGACNDNFLRDNSILVVVIITDDPPFDFDLDDAHPTTDTTMWYDLVLEAKNNDEKAIVVIGFVPWDNVACNGGLESPNLIGFVESFGEQGVLASVCLPDYSPVFAETVETIAETCENFVAPN